MCIGTCKIITIYVCTCACVGMYVQIKVHNVLICTCNLKYNGLRSMKLIIIIIWLLNVTQDDLKF